VGRGVPRPEIRESAEGVNAALSPQASNETEVDGNTSELKFRADRDAAGAEIDIGVEQEGQFGLAGGVAVVRIAADEGRIALVEAVEIGLAAILGGAVATFRPTVAGKS